jgi:hypothetical protein
VALWRYPDPCWDQTTIAGYIWMTYRLWWVAPCIAVVVGNRLWPRWGMLPAVAMGWAAAVFVWVAAGGIATMSNGHMFCIPMGDRASAVPLVLAPLITAGWGWRAQRQR